MLGPLQATPVHAGQGYLYCLDLLDKAAPGYWLINQHVAPMFRFDAERLRRMRAELRRREELLGELTPLPGANFAVDESWARLYPYAVRAQAGETADVELRLYNHASKPTEFRIRWNVPEGWRLEAGESRVSIPARSEGAAKARLRAAAPPECAVLTTDIAFAGFDLRRWTEALLESAVR